MKENRLESAFIYRANRKEGFSTYENTPCPTKECFETIGQEGIDFICDKIREMVLMRIYMFGNRQPEFYGLPSMIHFAHLPSCSIITVNDSPFEFHKKELQFPELIDEEHFTLEAQSHKGRTSRKSLEQSFSRGIGNPTTLSQREKFWKEIK